jgi:hypothetical protein
MAVREKEVIELPLQLHPFVQSVLNSVRPHAGCRITGKHGFSLG